MAIGDNMMDLALQITADPTQAQAGISQLEARLQELNAQVGKSGAAFAEYQQVSQQLWEARYAAAQKAAAATKEAADADAQASEVVKRSTLSELESLGLVKDAWMQNAAAAREQGAAATAAAREQVAAVDALNESYTNFGSVADTQIASVLADADNVGVAIRTAGDEAEGAAAKATRGTSLWHTMNQGIIGDMRIIRYSMYAFTTPLMFTYIIPQIARMVKGIQDGISAMEGFGAAAQKAFADIVKGSDEALTKFQGLTTAQKIWQGQILEAQTQQRINADIAARQVITQQSYLHNLAVEVLGLIEALGGSSATLSVWVAQFGVKAAALKDELQQEALLAKQHEALAQLEKQLQQETAKSAKAAQGATEWQQKWDAAIATARVHLPPFISDIERLQKALLLPEGKQNNTLFAYAEENAQRLQEGLKPLEATLEQLGITTPKLTMTGQPTGTLNAEIQAVQQLTAAQRLALPTERELALANAELARDYPSLTAAERQEWAQVMLTSDAYRKHIDEASRVKSSNTMLGGSFNALSLQVRTAFSEMAGQITGWGGVATRVFDQVFSATSRQIGIEQRHAGVAQLSAAATAKATIDGLKQIAAVKAVVDFAKGLEELAEAFLGHPGAAAAAVQDFAAAALWGTVGAFQIASMAGAFQPGTSGSKAVAAAGTSSAASGSPPALASGSASAAARQNQQQQILQVVFNGPVVGAGGMQEVADKLNHEVEVHRVKLVASHTLFGKALA